MVLKNYWIFYKKGLPSHLCKDIVQYALSKSKAVKAKVTSKNDKNQDVNVDPIKTVRDSEIIWLNDKWLATKILKMVQVANIQANWNFNISTTEEVQFTIYKQGMHYSWHCDENDYVYPETVNDKNLIGKTRKISAAVLLNNVEEFRGGEFEFDYRNRQYTNIETVYNLESAGDVIVFPSNTWHRVRPVSHGVRYSLVMWVCGEPFK
jgi:PKHD-type hydroxylase|tara:strand:- start:88 stop:708 length:621 start_codon:yes stop_codon:yes gene_type:complete